MDVSMSSVRSEDDVIDDSVIEESFTISRRAKSAPRNQITTVIAESEDDDYDEESGSETQTTRESIVRKSISASSSEEEPSPEIVPKRRPFGMKAKSLEKSDNKLPKPTEKISNRVSAIRKSLEESFIGRRGRKVMVLEDSESENDEPSVGNEEEDDEDEMVVSAATRMSILGVRPKDMPSDESDFIQSDESDNRISSYRGTMSKASSTSDLDDLPDVSMTPQKTPHKSPSTQTPAANISIDLTDDSKISCSPIGSPIHDLTMDGNTSYMALSTENTPMRGFNRSRKSEVLVDLTNRMDLSDDEVKVVDSKPEVIDISSDDDNHPLSETQNVLKTSPRQPKKSVSPRKDIQLKEEPPSTTKTKSKENTMKQYLLPSSYPNQGVVYVSKQVRSNELQKLEGLREDLHNVKGLLKQMDLTTLPDRGVKLMNRLDKLEEDVKIQEQKVADMVVDPNDPGDFGKRVVGKNEKGLSWDDIQAVSNQVQPRMFGKQAMATHMAERNVTLDRLRDLHESLASRPAETATASPPAALRSPLMPHQLHALAWLQWRETQKPRGGILADDMGLGKTITMISLVATSKERLDDGDDDNDWRGKGNIQLVRGGTLVVCPASLLQQWAGEVTKHCKSNILSVTTHHGASRATHAQRLAHSDLVLTTYNILQRDNEKNGVLMKIRWSRVILDEAHIVRNHKSATSVAVSALEGDCRWCLTGTPVQNKDLDMFALLKFLRCTPFDDLTMWKKWIDNKSLGGQERLSTIMRCLLLRRTKEQLQLKGELTCLPERTLHQVDVALSKEEMNVYQKVLVFSKTLFAQFLHQRAEKQASLEGGFLPRAGKSDPYAKMHNKMVALHGAKPVKSHEILVLLLRLRQLCCHCGLIAGMLDGADEPETEDVGGLDLLAELHKLTLQDQMVDKDASIVNEEDAGEGTTVAEAIRSVLSPSNPVFNLSNQSSKVLAVIECLKKNVFANKGEKAVIVSQWTSVLRLVERELAALSVRCVTLSGAVPVPQRAAIVDTFNNAQSSVQVMLLSLCAGGVGLNLCGGNHLLLLDPHWNPQLEQQARDRIYRVGQTKHVHIYKFVCTDTVEQSIRRLQELKLELAESVLTGARHSAASKLSIEDLKMLFNIAPSV